MTRLPVYAAWLAAGVATAVTIGFASYSPWGTDPASYVAAARDWASGELFTVNHFLAWHPPAEFGIPYGFRAGTIPGVHVPMYPLGYALFLAVAELTWTELGPHLVAPLFLGVLVLATFAVARRVTNDWGALLAACMTALNPIALGFAVTPMSDVPAAALVMLAIAMSVRASLLSAAAAGACIAAAVLMRPISAPLAVVPLALTLAGGSAFNWRAPRWRHALVLTLVAALGPALLAWSQLVLYGGALTPGYPEFDSFFSTDRMATNAAMYFGHLLALHSPVFFAGAVAAVPLYFTRDTRDRGSLALLIALIALALVNYAGYLPYTTYVGVPYLRFLLPAQTAVFILLASCVADAAAAAARLWKPLAVVCVVPALLVVYEGRALFSMVTSAYAGQSHMRLMGRYLREALPPNAVVFSLVHGTGLAHYTDRPIVRWDLAPKGSEAEQLIERLRARRYRPVLVLDEQNEGPQWEIVFRGTPFAKPGWSPRASARLPGSSRLLYFDFADQHRAGDPPGPVDALR